MKRLSFPLLLALSAAALFAAEPSTRPAGGPPAGGPPSDAQLKADFPELFAKADADSDGTLSREERRALCELMREAGIRPPGGPGGGPGRGNPLANADSDGDGVISKAEFTTAITTMGPPGRRGGHGPEGGRGPDGAAGQRPTPPGLTEAIATAFTTGDADGNGSLNASEQKAAMDALRSALPRPPRDGAGGPPGDRDEMGPPPEETGH